MNLSARKLQQAAENGFKRLRNFRAARMMYLNAFTGPYYNQESGRIGDSPLNMAFNAIRVLVPNLVTRAPKAVVRADYTPHRNYAELLALGLNYLGKKLDLPEILQRGIVDAIFTIGIFKVGLATSDSLVHFGEEGVDPGQLYTETVDFDDFTFDPATKHLKKGLFQGEKMRVDRQLLLESGLYDNAVVEQLPSSADMALLHDKSSRSLSTGALSQHELTKLVDYVDLIELWLRGPNVLVTLPADRSSDQGFLREETFYGPDDGPYAFLTLSPPVPNNPLPVALASIWHDLHILINQVAKKTMDQAKAQKDVLGYRPDSADDAQELIDAKNLDAIKMTDPTGAQMFSFGGSNPRNEQFLAQTEVWFNTMAGNMNQMGGLAPQTNVATVATILDRNSATGVTYMRDQVRKTTNAILRKCAWYLHTDPLIELPLIQRDTIPARYAITDLGIQMIEPAKTEETQVFLTPEVRRGDFLDFAFDIEHDSMAPINWTFQLQQLETLAVRIMPAAANAAQIAAQMGTPFSFEKFVIRAAKLMGIEGIEEIFQSPELVAQMMAVMQAGPQAANSKGIASPAATQQNRGAAVGKTTPSESLQQRQVAQQGANAAQATLPIREI